MVPPSVKNLYSILTGQPVCTLCYKSVDEEMIEVTDLLTLENEEDISFADIISALLTEEETNLVSSKLCPECARSLTRCYQFLENCRNTQKALLKLTNNFLNSLENSPNELYDTTTLFIGASASNDFHNYYDSNPSIKTVKKAYKRFKSLSKTPTERRRIRQEKEMINYATCDSQDNQPAQKLICECCSKIFTDSKGLGAHFTRVHAPKIHKCEICNKSFGAAYLLRLHQSETHVTVMCATCGKSYKNMHSLKMHSVSHTKLTCPICGRQYKTRVSYRKHVKSKICTKETRRKRVNIEKLYICDVCTKSFAHKSTLLVHIKFEHENGKAYSCTWCNKKFPAQSRLKSHIVTHTKERNFTCEICGGKFVTKEALLYHTRIHTGETPYACQYCDQKFLSSSRRMDHIRRKHMGPTMECNICNAKFRTPCTLRKHKRRHFNPKSRLFTQNLPENVVV